MCTDIILVQFGNLSPHFIIFEHFELLKCTQKVRQNDQAARKTINDHYHRIPMSIAKKDKKILWL